MLLIWILFFFGCCCYLTKWGTHLFAKWTGRLGKHHDCVVFDVLFYQVFNGRHFVRNFRRRRSCPLQVWNYNTNGGKEEIIGTNNIYTWSHWGYRARMWLSIFLNGRKPAPIPLLCWSRVASRLVGLAIYPRSISHSWASLIGPKQLVEKLTSFSSKPINLAR